MKLCSSFRYRSKMTGFHFLVINESYLKSVVFSILVFPIKKMVANELWQYPLVPISQSMENSFLI